MNFNLHVANARQTSTLSSQNKSKSIDWSTHPPWIAIGISALGAYLSLIGITLYSASELRADMTKDKAELRAEITKLEIKLDTHMTKLETKLDRHLDANNNLMGKCEVLEKVILKKAWW